MERALYAIYGIDRRFCFSALDPEAAYSPLPQALPSPADSVAAIELSDDEQLP